LTCCAGVGKPDTPLTDGHPDQLCSVDRIFQPGNFIGYFYRVCCKKVFDKEDMTSTKGKEMEGFSFLLTCP